MELFVALSITPFHYYRILFWESAAGFFSGRRYTWEILLVPYTRHIVTRFDSIYSISHCDLMFGGSRLASIG